MTFMQTGDPRVFNRYSYAFNDPTNLTDPTGMLPPEGTVSGELASGHSLKHAQGISDAFAPASEAGFKGAVLGVQIGLTGGIGAGVSRGILAVTAKVAAPTTTKLGQAANVVAANTLGGGVAGATVEAGTQIAQDGKITDGGAVFNKGATAAILSGAASTAGQTVQATANAFKSGGGASTQGAALGAGTTQVLDAAGTASGVEIPVKEHFEVD